MCTVCCGTTSTCIRVCAVSNVCPVYFRNIRHIFDGLLLPDIERCRRMRAAHGRNMVYVELRLPPVDIRAVTIIIHSWETHVFCCYTNSPCRKKTRKNFFKIYDAKTELYLVNICMFSTAQHWSTRLPTYRSWIHAGVLPGRPPKWQKLKDKRAIRSPPAFLQTIHGVTVTSFGPERLPPPCWR